jgi:hypothetical protein
MRLIDVFYIDIGLPDIPNSFEIGFSFTVALLVLLRIKTQLSGGEFIEPQGVILLVFYGVGFSVMSGRIWSAVKQRLLD